MPTIDLNQARNKLKIKVLFEWFKFRYSFQKTLDLSTNTLLSNAFHTARWRYRINIWKVKEFVTVAKRGQTLCTWLGHKTKFHHPTKRVHSLLGSRAHQHRWSAHLLRSEFHSATLSSRAFLFDALHFTSVFRAFPIAVNTCAPSSLFKMPQ